MEKTFSIIIVSAIIMLILDAIYLTSSSAFFSNIVANIQRTALILKPMGAIVCYIFLIFGLYYFILKDKRSPADAFLLGIIIYGVYEATNYAILKKWPVSATIIDTLWGGVLFYLTTWITYNLV